MNGTIIAAIVCFVVAVLGAWVTYRIFRKEGPVVGPFRFVTAISKRKENGMDVIEYKIYLPVSPSKDVAKKIFTIRRADTGGGMFEPVEVVELPNEQTEVWRKAVQDTRVDCELVAVDDSGNRSDPVYMYFTALDTIKPVLPGEMTVEGVGEDPASSEDDSAVASPAEGEAEAEAEAEDAEFAEGEGSESPPAHVQPPAEGAEADPTSPEGSAETGTPSVN